MDFHGSAFLFSLASFCTTFINKNVVGLSTATCVKDEVET